MYRLNNQWYHFFLFNIPVNNVSVMLGRSHCFLGIYQYFGELKVFCSRTLHGGRSLGSNPGPLCHRAHLMVPLENPKLRHRFTRVQVSSNVTTMCQVKKFVNVTWIYFGFGGRVHLTLFCIKIPLTLDCL